MCRKSKSVTIKFISYYGIREMKPSLWSPFHWTLACIACELSLTGWSEPMSLIKDKIPAQVISLLGAIEIKGAVKLSHRNSPYSSVKDIFGKLLSQVYNLIKAETKWKERYKKTSATSCIYSYFLITLPCLKHHNATGLRSEATLVVEDGGIHATLMNF